MTIRVILELDNRLARFLWILLNKELRRLRREIDRRPADFVLKGRDITKHKIMSLNQIIDKFLKGGYSDSR